MFQAFICKILKNMLSAEFELLNTRIRELDSEVLALREKHTNLAERHLQLHDKYRRTKNVVRNIERSMTRKSKMPKAA